MQIDHLADEHGATNMGCNQLEPSAHPVIDRPLLGMAHGGEYRTTCYPLLQIREQAIHQALRGKPLAKEAGLNEFVARNDVGNGDRLLHVEENDSGKNWIDLPVLLPICL